MRVLSGGVLQVTVCVLLIMFLVPLMTKLFGFNMFLSKGFFLGSFISISSTAIVIKLLTDKNLVESLYGKIIVEVI